MRLILKSGLAAAMVFALLGASTPALALYGGTFAPSGCLAGKAKCIIKKKSCLLGCYNKAVGKGVAVDQACIDKCKNGFDADPAIPGKGCFAKLEAKNDACGLSLGDAAVFEAKIDAHVLDIVAELAPKTGAAFTLNKCTAGKIKCVIKYNACILGLVSKAAKAGTSIGDTSKCDAILKNAGKATCFEKLELKPPCLTVDDQFALRNKDNSFVDDVIAELVADPDHYNQRCNGNTFVKCSSPQGSVVGCGGPLGTCEFYFGSYLPLAAGGVTTCVSSQWNGPIAGTFNQQTGASAGTASVLARVSLGITVPKPCPQCVGDVFPNDGVTTGACSGGTRNTLACDSNGVSPEPAFGSTSLDCPPSTGVIATIPIDLTNTNSGTVTATVTALSPNCSGAPGKKCLCGVCSSLTTRPCKVDTDCTGFGTCTTVGVGVPEAPNACVDDTTGPPDETGICQPIAGGEGVCPGGPITGHCKLRTFEGCTFQVTDCQNEPGDVCQGYPRECFAGYQGAVNDTITAVGDHDDPRNHVGTQQFASIFCVAPTSQLGVNQVAGLPGPGRLQLLGIGSENGTSLACPTTASFLPSVKGGVLDTGWTGISHDAKVIGQGKVTVQVTTCSAPGGFATSQCGTCSYTGPVKNPNPAPTP